MKTKVFFTTLYFITLHIICCESSISRKIPEHLMHCYRNVSFEFNAPKNLRLLVELISKIERNNVNYNIRSVSNSLLHSLKLDGIERALNVQESENVIPYRASAFQYSKYSFFVDSLISNDNPVKMYEALTPDEICALHFLISSTVYPWERGDEFKVCPLNMPRNSPFTSNAQESNTKTGKPIISRCPIEMGVIKTPWGNIAPGTLITSVSAALEPQNIKLTDLLEKAVTVEEEMSDLDSHMDEFTSSLTKFARTSDKYLSNILAASLVGELAELIIRQGPYVLTNDQKYVFGPSGRWNDSLLPRDYYMMQSPPLQWEVTDAELLGAIDGYIIAHHVKNWTATRYNTRLSQVLDMYYSPYGVSFDETIKACNRKKNLMTILNMSEIRQQTLNMVHLLWMRLSHVYMGPEQIEAITDSAVNAFAGYWPSFIDTLPGCEIEPSVTNPMDIILATDGSWTKYETEQLVSILSNTFDIFDQSSSFSLVHGTTGDWISQRTHSVLELFTDLGTSTNTWVNRLDLPNIMTSVIALCQNDTETEFATMKGVALPRVVVIAAPNSRWSQPELDKTKTIMELMKTNRAEVYFLYITGDEHAFRQLLIGSFPHSDMFINSTKTDVVEVAKSIGRNFNEKVPPKRIIPQPCNTNNVRYNFEDYVSKGRKAVYMIHPKHIRGIENLNILFQALDYGEIVVCISRIYDESKADFCKIVIDDRDIIFDLHRPCDDDACNPVFFMVRAAATYFNCADKECRYPHQIRFSVRHKGLNCLNNGTSAGNPIHEARHYRLQSIMLSLIYMIVLKYILN